jgi:hypothetical protein
MPRYRKKPLAQLEHGTRVYAPSPGEACYRVVATDSVSGERIFVKCRTEELARAKARELEQCHGLAPGRGCAATNWTCSTGPGDRGGVGHEHAWRELAAAKQVMLAARRRHVAMRVHGAGPMI